MGSCFGEGIFVGVYNFICLSYKWTVANRKCQLTMPYQRYKNVICFVLIFSVWFVLRTTRARGALWSLFLYFSHEVLSSYATIEKKTPLSAGLMEVSPCFMSFPQLSVEINLTRDESCFSSSSLYFPSWIGCPFIFQIQLLFFYLFT